MHMSMAFAFVVGSEDLPLFWVVRFYIHCGLG